MLAVLGATGNTGRATCEALLRSGQMVKVVGRNLEKLAEFALAGAELAIADSLDVGALTKAFEGASGIYAMIGVDPTVDDYDAHYDAIGEAITLAIEASGVSHVVALSGIGSHLPPEMTKSMGAIETGRRQEERLNTLTDVNIVHLRPGFFMQNFLRDVHSVRESKTIRGPLIADKPIAMVSAKDIGERAAELLTSHNFAGQQANDLLGPRDIAPNEATKLLGKLIEIDELDYREISIDEFRSGMISGGVSASCAAAIAGIYEGYNSGHLVPEHPRDSASLTPTTIEDFGAEFVRAFRTMA